MTILDRSGRVWKTCLPFVFLILTVWLISSTVHASGNTVRTDPGRINRFVYHATTQTNHEGLRDAARSSSDTTSMLLADGNGTSATGYIRTDIHYVDRNNNGILDFAADDLVYCLHNRKRSPTGGQTFQILNYSQALDYMWSSWREQTVANDKASLDGLVAILQNGFPAKTASEMGFGNNGDAYAATQMAIRFWVAEREHDLRRSSWTYNFYDQTRAGYGSITAMPGQQSVLDKALALRALAKNPPAREITMSASLLSAAETRSQRDFFIYRYRVNLTNLSDGYTIVSMNLPTGSTCTGYTGKTGDILEIKIPFTQANAGKGFSIGLRGTDSAGVSSLEFRPVPSSSNAYQGLIGINMGVVDTTINQTPSRTTRTIADPYVHSITTNKSIYAPGESGTATIILRNMGNRRAEASVLKVNGTRYTVGWIDPPNGSSTKSRTINTSFTVPSTAVGGWSLPIQVDADDDVLEVNQPGIGENNNSLSYPIAVGRPDLVITAATISSTQINPGDSATITVTVRNQGTVPAGRTSILALSAGPSHGVTTPVTQTTSNLAAGASANYTFTWTAPADMPLNTQVAMTFMADATNVIAESSESNNTRQLRFTPIWCDLSLVNLTFDQNSYEAGEVVTLSTSVRNIGYWASQPYSLVVHALDQIGLLNETRTMPVLASRATSQPQIFTFIAPTLAEDTMITVRASIPHGQSYAGVTSMERSVLIKAGLPDLSIIDSTIQDYFTDKEVVISALIRNSGGAAVPDVQVQLTFADQDIIESIPVPASGTNRVVFRVRTPTQPGSYPVAIEVDPEQEIDESDISNNTLTRQVNVADENRIPIPDPDWPVLEQTFIAGAKKLPDLIVPADSARHTWQEIRLENGSYISRSFWVQLDTEFSVIPDPRVAISGKPRLIESGFGLKAAAETVLTTNYDYPEKLVGPQMVYLFYPETNFGRQPFTGYADALIHTKGATGDHLTSWAYPPSPFSLLGSRLHFTPLFIPDGPYPILAQTFYAWSPLGQLFEYQTDSVQILGSMYDRVTVVRR